MQQVANTPLYLDWSFWAVVVASIAIVLSQIPPIHMLFKKAKIDFEVYSKISLMHKVGNPNLQLHLIITNVGGRKLRIKGVTATLLRGGNQIAVLPAQNYIQNPNDNNTVLFTSFSLKPNEEWGYIINLLNFFKREEEREYRQMESRLKADILAKRSQIKGESTELIEADPDNVTPFLTFFRQRFVWRAGEYQLFVKVRTDQTKADVEKAYRFTLFESYSDELSAITKEYKYGAGIYWLPNTPTSVIVDITEA